MIKNSLIVILTLTLLVTGVAVWLFFGFWLLHIITEIGWFWLAPILVCSWLCLLVCFVIIYWSTRE